MTSLDGIQDPDPDQNDEVRFDSDKAAHKQAGRQVIAQSALSFMASILNLHFCVINDIVHLPMLKVEGTYIKAWRVWSNTSKCM